MIKRCNQLKTTLNQHVSHIIQIIHVLLKKENNQLKGKKHFIYSQILLN